MGWGQGNRPVSQVGGALAPELLGHTGVTHLWRPWWVGARLQAEFPASRS